MTVKYGKIAIRLLGKSRENSLPLSLKCVLEGKYGSKKSNRTKTTAMKTKKTK